jgi:hypothetical protein
MAADTTRQRAAEAADILRSAAADPAIREIIVSLTAVGEGEDDALEKAMTKIGVARETLVKDESVTPAQAFEVGQRLEKAERAVQREYMLKHSAGYRNAEASNAEAARLREANFGRAA